MHIHIEKVQQLKRVMTYEKVSKIATKVMTFEGNKIFVAE